MAAFRRFCFALLAAFVITFSGAVSATADFFSQALLSLKSELVDDYNCLGNWVLRPDLNPSPTIQACSWSGVVCNKNATTVVGLNLASKNLRGVLSGNQFDLFPELVDLNLSDNAFSGELPQKIFNLTQLRSLDISRNNFSGNFPAGISGLQRLVILDALSNSFSGPLPTEVSQIRVLKFLNLAGSYFTGPIPPEYGSFKSIEFIHLAGNILTGSIPPELGKLKTVLHMEIGYNRYQGSIPGQLGNMSQLQYLDIASANLSGPIPKELCNLTKVESLFLFRNYLSGPIPWELSRITALKSLDFSDNQISGRIPESFGELKNLRLLSLMSNEMNGSVPEGIAELPNLETLYIWDNFFSGSLPKSLGFHSKLISVDVSTNRLVGGIPPNICAGGMLLKLIMFSNGFTGGLSPSLSNCSSLIRLRIENNSFSGEIALNFSLLKNATYVDLSTNRFTGGIPKDWSQASQLQFFNISKNPELGGIIPEETWSQSRLQNFSAYSCNISGSIPQFKECQSVVVIELGSNRLSGPVPESISKCEALERIDLASNNLSGHIPDELAGLRKIGTIDLSHNHLRGEIPLKFSTSSSLLLLNVSFNDISGSIPSEGVFRLIGSSAFVGNPQLCGTPLQPCSGSMDIQHDRRWGSEGIGKLIRVLMLCAGVALFVALSVLGIIYLQKGNQGRWKMVSFIGLPQFTENDVLRSFDSTECVDTVTPQTASFCKAVLPTGITVSVKKIDLEAKRSGVMLEFMTQMGNVRHKNLIRLLGFCYNNRAANLLYDYLPNGNLSEKIKMKRDWSTKCRIVAGIARGLCYLHHDCYPAIPHGALRSTNVLFDENMEPRLADFGLKFLVEAKQVSFSATLFTKDTGDLITSRKEELCMDIYNFGEIILEVLTNGRLTKAGESMHRKPTAALLRELYHENAVESSSLLQEEIKLVLDVALLCTKSSASDRPSIEDALKLLSGLKSLRK